MCNQDQCLTFLYAVPVKMIGILPKKSIKVLFAADHSWNMIFPLVMALTCYWAEEKTRSLSKGEISTQISLFRPADFQGNLKLDEEILNLNYLSWKIYLLFSIFLHTICWKCVQNTFTFLHIWNGQWRNWMLDDSGWFGCGDWTVVDGMLKICHFLLDM